jgi:stage V sporulation protein SpoVS
LTYPATVSVVVPVGVVWDVNTSGAPAMNESVEAVAVSDEFVAITAAQ